MKEFKYVITDAEGIHARPATMLVRLSMQKVFSESWDLEQNRVQRLQLL